MTASGHRLLHRWQLLEIGTRVLGLDSRRILQARGPDLAFDDVARITRFLVAIHLGGLIVAGPSGPPLDRVGLVELVLDGLVAGLGFAHRWILPVRQIR